MNEKVFGKTQQIGDYQKSPFQIYLVNEPIKDDLVLDDRFFGQEGIEHWVEHTNFPPLISVLRVQLKQDIVVSRLDRLVFALKIKFKKMGNTFSWNIFCFLRHLLFLQKNLEKFVFYQLLFHLRKNVEKMNHKRNACCLNYWERTPFVNSVHPWAIPKRLLFGAPVDFIAGTCNVF